MAVDLEPMPFEEAVEFFADKVVLQPQVFYSLWHDLRSRAFSIAGITALDILKDIHHELLKAIEEGRTQQEFGKSANEVLERKGWKGLTPFRIDNIFRTNIQTAYMVGHYRRLTDPDVAERRPYWMYDAVNDRRTRPTHAAMDGMVYRYDHPFWDTWYPPNGYRCRCGVRNLSERDVERQGLTVESEIPALVEPPGMPARPLRPDPGFAHNPAKVEWEPNIKDYPEALQNAYERRKDRNGSGRA